jgi:hypothetical protein
MERNLGILRKTEGSSFMVKAQFLFWPTPN